MTPRAAHVREQVVKAEKELERRKADLVKLEAECPHEWEAVDPRVDTQRAYTIPAWKAGSDFSPETHVPSKRTVYHRRQCFHCGKIEETTKTKVKKVIDEPDFGDART